MYYHRYLWLDALEHWACRECLGYTRNGGPLGITHHSECSTPKKLEIEREKDLQTLRESVDLLKQEIKEASRELLELEQRKEKLLLTYCILDGNAKETWYDDFIVAYAQLD